MNSVPTSKFVTNFQFITGESDSNIISSCYNYTKGDFNLALKVYYQKYAGIKQDPQPVVTNIAIRNSNIATVSALAQPESALAKNIPNPQNKISPIKLEEKKRAKSPIVTHNSPNMPTTKTFEEVARSLTKWVEKTPLDIYEHIQKQTNKLQQENCPICLSELYENINKTTINQVKLDTANLSKGTVPVVLMGECLEHYYHKECLLNAIKAANSSTVDSAEIYYKCCICNKVYGVLMGNQPKNGKMKHILYQPGDMPIEGYENIGTIEITYTFPRGNLNGVNYTGTGRVAYLPDNPEGNEILKLLQIAFQRGHTFTIGTSITTGKQNTIVWNGIHHKTALGGGTKWYGYPDPTYFKRVKEELAAKGVTVADLK